MNSTPHLEESRAEETVHPKGPTLRLVAVTGVYPTEDDPLSGAFIHVFLRDLRSLGVATEVIAPERAVAPRRRASPSRRERMDGVHVHRPRFLSLSNRRLPLGLSTYRWTVANFRRAVLKAARDLPPPDLCYAHFLYPAGYAALALAERWRVPAVLGAGESSYTHYELHMGLGRTVEDFRRFDGIVAPSESTAELLATRYKVSRSRARVFPNAVADYFRPTDREEARRKLGLPADGLIVAFVGHFDERKGPHRLLASLERVPGVRGVFIGRGDWTPQGSQVLFAGSVPHREVPLWLSASDIFALPTLAEGSPNAVREAMACGLPVVSSDLPFNREFLDESVALLVDPTDVEALATAIGRLARDERLRRSMGRAALERARTFRSLDRAKAILHWMSQLAAGRDGSPGV